ncbi:MAG: T9SS type A sorting domain-containing protein [Saprospiraceae bacterium]
MCIRYRHFIGPGLLAYTTYQFHCRIYCSSGWTAYSGSQYFTTTSGGNSCTNPIELSCSSSNYSGSNNTGNYNYTSYPFAGSTGMTGPEAYHRLTIVYPALVTFTMTPQTQDLDLFLLSNCDNSSGLAYSQNEGTNTEQFSVNLSPGTYYLLVDGWNGAISNYTLLVSCSGSTACAAPSYDGIYASDVTCSTARLNCSAGGYTWKWAYRPLNSVAWIYLPSTFTPYTDLSGLQASTTYEFIAAKRCSNNTWSDWSPVRQFTTSNCGPTGNNCNNPLTAYCGYTYTGNNGAGSYNFNGYYYNGYYYSETGPEMIYRLNWPTSGPLTLTLFGLTGDLDLFLLSSCSNNAVLKASLNSGSNGESILVNNLPAGTYLIIIDGFQNTTSNYGLSVAGNCPNNNSNDEPCYAAPIIPYTSCYLTNATNVGATATTNPLPPAECNTVNMRDVWFRVQIPVTGHILVSTFPGTLTNALLGIYAGTLCTGLTNWGCFDNNPNGDLMPDVYIGGEPGSYVYLRVWGYSGTTGTFSICVTTLTGLQEGESDVTIGDTAGAANRGAEGNPAYKEKDAKLETEAAALRLYPVPAQEELHLSAILAVESNLTVRIVSMTGQLVQEETFLNAAAGEFATTLDIRSLPSGSYLLRFQSDGQETTGKFVKL